MSKFLRLSGTATGKLTSVDTISATLIAILPLLLVRVGLDGAEKAPTEGRSAANGLITRKGCHKHPLTNSPVNQATPYYGLARNLGLQARVHAVLLSADKWRSVSFFNSLAISKQQASSHTESVEGASHKYEKTQRIDVTSEAFSLGCPNAADPTGQLDSTCALRMAIKYAASQPISKDTVPVVYLSGTFKISDALRVPCDVLLTGDSKASATIRQTSLTANAVTFTSSDRLITSSGFICQGGLRNLSLTGPGSAGRGTLLETIQTSGLNIVDVVVANTGGRGINFTGQSERTKATNIEIDGVRWPWILSGNENHVRGVQINSPGVTYDGYSFDIANAVNGVVIDEAWTKPQQPSSLYCESGVCTVVVSGGSHGSDSNGVSPLAVGHAFQLAGVQELTAANGIFRVLSVKNNTPTPSQYTVTFALAGASGSVALSNATFKPVRFPTHNAAITFIGADVVLEQGSIKSMQHAAGVDAETTYGSRISDIYFEGFPVNDSPRLSSDIIAGNLPQQTTLTSPLSTKARMVGVASTMWMYNYLNDPVDAASGSNQGLVMLAPPDYLRGADAASTMGAGVKRGQFENAYVTFSGPGTAFIFGRHLKGSTAHADVVWPPGTRVILYPPGANFGMLKIANNHLQGLDTPGAAWASGCSDGTDNVCATIVAGGIENGATTLSAAQNGSTYTMLDVDNNEWWTSNDEVVGEGFIKFVGSGGQLQVTGSDNARNVGVGYEAINGVLNGFGGGSPSFQNIRSADGSYPEVHYVNHNVDLHINTPDHTYRSSVESYGDKVLGSNPSQAGEAYGAQIANSYCTYDVPPAGQQHALNRICFLGGPDATGQSAGFKVQMWDKMAWLTTFSVDGSGTVSMLRSPRTGTHSNTDHAGILQLINGKAKYAFAEHYLSAPICTVSDTTKPSLLSVSVTPESLTVSGDGSDLINYICAARD